MTVNAPQVFAGTDEQREANRRTHAFGSEDRCMFCDCRPWGRVAEWPCGVEPPRVTDETAGVEFDARFQIYAGLKGVTA